jgi:hypothetical protein
MRRQIHTFNGLLRIYNKYLRKRKNLLLADKNIRRQRILAKHIDRLYVKLMSVKLSIQKGVVATTVVLGALALPPQEARAQTSFELPSGNPFGLSYVDRNSAPTFADLDGDGDLDMLTGAYYGNFYYFKNTGTALLPTFAGGQSNPFGLSSSGYYSSPVATFADLDGDGDFDILAGDNYGGFKYFQNTGTPTSPAYVAGISNPFGITAAGNKLLASPGDLDGDGDLDILIGYNDGSFKYFKNTGTASSPNFAAAQSNPFGIISPGGQVKSDFADVDGDGDLDMVACSSGTGIYYFENTGTALVPAFSPFQINPFQLSNDYYESVPAFADLNGDGKMDVVLGNSDGNYIFFENYLSKPCTSEQTVSAALLTLCNSGATTINVGSSETGISYSLRNDLNDTIVAGPIAGTGSGIAFNTGMIAATTKYNVYANRTGESSYIYKPGHTTLAGTANNIPVGGSQYTIEVWINSASISGASGLVGWGTYAVQHQCNAFRFNGAYQLINYWWGNDFAVNTPNLADGKWHHCVATYNGTTNSIYVDGVLMGSRTIGANPPNVGSANNLEIGSTLNGGEVFQGALDNIRIWNTGKTQLEIQALYSSCSIPATTPGLVAYYTFSEASGTILDGTTNANHLNYSGARRKRNGSACGSCLAEMTQTVTVTVKPKATNTMTIKVCSGEDFTYADGTAATNITSNTSHSSTLAGVAANGCDSIVIQNITSIPVKVGSVNKTICTGESILVNGTTYNAANPTGTEVFTNVGLHGCDSTVTVNLTSTIIDLATTIVNNTITVNESSATYRWLDCRNSDAIIPAETAQSYNASSDGIYAVEVTVGNCMDTSDCQNLLITGVKGITRANIYIYPNPTDGLFTIKFTDQEEKANYILTTIEGKIVSGGSMAENNTVLDLSKESQGIYFLILKQENTNEVYKVVRH